VDVTVEEYAGPHRDLEWSFRLAEDSDQQLDSYIDLGRVWVARTPDHVIVGHVHVVDRDHDVWEVVNTAVAEHAQNHGVGRAMLEKAADEARAAGAVRLTVSTAAASTGNLRFYQRCGFRMTHVVPDAFGTTQGYPPGIEIDGIPMLDQIWFERVL
jgi:GNAT superfamily N-acetyltransferase